MDLSRRSLLMGAAAGAAPARPNVLTILCDQLNAAATSVYGGPVATPNLERLARRGVVFSNATCPTPFCSPSRASIVTGRYPHGHGIVYNVSKVDYPFYPSAGREEGLAASDATADKILHAAGWSTHQYGKWHLSGDRLPYYPDPYGEHHEYAREMAEAFAEARKRPAGRKMDWYGWILPVEQNPAYARSFSPDEAYLKNYTGEFISRMGRLELPLRDTFDARVADRTVARIRAAGEKPFSITCSLNWPHDPNVAPSPYYEQSDPRRIELPANHTVREPRFEKDLSRQMVGRDYDLRMREFLRIYYATVRIVDEQVGRILDELERSGRASSTLVVFAADHGDMAGGHGMAWKSNSSFYDEIALIPLIVSWPGRIQPGKTEAAASLVDLAPTILELTGQAALPGAQGRSLAPLLLGRSSAAQYVYGIGERVRPNAERTRAVAPRNPAELMIRGEGWKYAAHSNGDEYLYDLRRDPGETRNLAGERSAGAQRREMRKELIAALARTGYPGGAPPNLKGE